MDLLAQVAQFAGEHQFDLGVDVFHIVFDHEGAGFNRDEDVVESLGERFQFFLVEQADAFQHPDVCLRPFDVAGGKPQVEYPVVSDGESLHDLRGGGSFIP